MGTRCFLLLGRGMVGIMKNGKKRAALGSSEIKPKPVTKRMLTFRGPCIRPRQKAYPRDAVGAFIYMVPK